MRCAATRARLAVWHDAPTVGLEALRRLALSRPAGEGGLTPKVAAIARLVQAGDRSPVPIAKLRAELRAVARLEVVSTRGQDAVLRSVDVLDELDAPPPEPQDQGFDFDNPFAELVLPIEMATRLKLDYGPEFWESSRGRRLTRDASRILRSDDPAASLERWTRRHARPAAG